MRCRGVVIKTEGHLAHVKVCHKEFCGNCGHHSPDEEVVTVPAKNAFGAKAQDVVMLESQTAPMLWSVLLVFWTPILAGILGAFLGKQLALHFVLNENVWMSVIGILFFLLDAIAVYFIGKKIKPGVGLKVLGLYQDFV